MTKSMNSLAIGAPLEYAQDKYQQLNDQQQRKSIREDERKYHGVTTICWCLQKMN